LEQYKQQEYELESKSRDNLHAMESGNHITKRIFHCRYGDIPNVRADAADWPATQEEGTMGATQSRPPLRRDNPGKFLLSPQPAAAAAALCRPDEGRRDMNKRDEQQRLLMVEKRRE
jgi:hypothetical protein